MGGRRRQKTSLDEARLALGENNRIESGGFVQVSQAARAEIHPLELAVFVDRYFLNIRLPLALGVHVGVADSIPERRCLAADIAFCHDCTSLT
jgi:hypothetical protein